MTSLPGVVVGVQQPRVCHVPEYISSAGQEAIELAALAGLELDPWEALVLTHALGEREDGKWAAFEVGLVVPRQNGKGAILEARELAGLFLFGERLLIHSAHEQATSSEHFRRLLNLIEGVPEFDRRVLKAPQGKGAEAIELRGGQRILFKTRTGGGGRGLTGNFVALDEAMILPRATTAALVPTMAATSIHGNPQLWYSGSAVDREQHEHGEVLARVRSRGLSESPRLAYFEWSAPGDNPGAVPEGQRSDPAMWAVANPGMGIRISEEHIENECAGALGPREFAVERLGVGDWPALDGDDPDGLSLKAWLRLTDEDSVLGDPVCFAFDVRPDRNAAAIFAAGRRPDGLAHLEVVEHRPGTRWVAPMLAELVTKWQPLSVKVAGRSPAVSLLPDLKALDIEVDEVDVGGHAQACGRLVDLVNDEQVRHLGTPEMAAAIKGAVRRSLGESWVWSRKSSAVDICPLVACTLALWGIESELGSVYEDRGLLVINLD